jgi:hypothetical protein
MATKWEYLYIDVASRAYTFEELLAEELEESGELDELESGEGASEDAGGEAGESAEASEDEDLGEADLALLEEMELMDDDEVDATPEAYMVVLDQIGEDGWELVSYDWERGVGIFKRPLDEDDDDDDDDDDEDDD